MEIPCDTIGAAVADYFDAGDFTPASRTTYRRVLQSMARALGPDRPVAEVDADQLAGWFVRTRDAYMPATWNRDRVIVRAFVRHLQQHGAALELPALGHRRIRPDTTRALSRADVTRILTSPAPLRERTLWRLLYESAARAGEVLALDVEDLDLANRRGRVVGKGGQVEWITWSTGTATLLPRLLKGRRSGPVFATRRPSRVIPAVLDRGPEATARLSYRRAEELFKAHAGATPAPAPPLRAHAHGRRRRLRAHADDQEPAPVHQQPWPLRPPQCRGAAALGGHPRPRPATLTCQRGAMDRIIVVTGFAPIPGRFDRLTDGLFRHLRATA